MRNVWRDKGVIAGRRGYADLLNTIMEYELGVAASYEDRCFGLAMMVLSDAVLGDT